SRLSTSRRSSASWPHSRAISASSSAPLVAMVRSRIERTRAQRVESTSASLSVRRVSIGGPRSAVDPRRESGKNRLRRPRAGEDGSQPMAAAENPPSGQATLLLRQMSQGDRQAAENLLSLLYGELHELAERAMAGQRAHTLQPTALVHEACLRLLGKQEQDWSNRAHFLGVAAKAMRSILVDYARQRSAGKRGGDYSRVPMESLLEIYE